ncbi:protein PAT1 homolog 1-like [Terrapene carolina triunguis]|uniref:protein PAT1 homolog 1-like n=1 Tax=Terrapene triunguis TaxID=2587831 RepID=UPI000E77D9C1|nr:protein PAT1 homolog 1-like [Terrapene carolina triunguis]
MGTGKGRGQKRGSEGSKLRSRKCGGIAAPGREKSLPAVGQAQSRPLLHAHAVLLLLSLQFGLSLLYLVLSRGEELQNSNAGTELMQDNQWTELMSMTTRELLQIPEAVLAKPVSTPSNLLSLFSRYVDQQKLNVLETKLQLVQGIR